MLKQQETYKIKMLR